MRKSVLLWLAACWLLILPAHADATYRQLITAEDQRDAAVLLKLCESKDPGVRARAVRALGRIQDPALIPSFARLALSDSPEVRREAIFALGQTFSARAAGPLLKLLDRNAPLTQQALVIEALGKTTADSDGRGIDALFALLEPSTHVELRLNAALALEDVAFRLRRASASGSVWQPSAANASRMIALLHDDAAPVRAAAAGALWRFAWCSDEKLRQVPAWADAARVALTGLLKDADPDVRMRSLQALAEVSAPSRLPGEVGALLDDRDWRVRVAAVDAIARAGADTAWPLLLENRLQDPHPLVVLAALRALETLAHRYSRPSPSRLVYGVYLNGDMPMQVRAEALRIAVAFQEFAGLPAPLPFGPSGETQHHDSPSNDAFKDWRLRRALLEGSVAHLKSTMQSADGPVRDIDRGGGFTPQYEVAVRHFLTDPDVRVRDAAADAVGGLMAVAAARKATQLMAKIQADLLNCLRDKDVIVRAAAADALVDQGVREAAGPIVDTLGSLDSSRDCEVMTSLIGALGRLGRPAEPRVETLLVHLSKDPNAVIAQAAGLAYKKVALAPLVLDDRPRALARAPVSEEALSFVDSHRGKILHAVIHTKYGDMTLRLFTDEAPLTVYNFVHLARAKYFDGLTFHRVVPNFVAQGGDPRGDGWGGPGYTIRCEYNPLRYERGMVGMALAGKDTGGSQFFITHSPQPRLNGRYTIFAQLVRGGDVLDALTEGDTMSVEIRE